MSLREDRTDPSPLQRYVAEAVCTDCDYSEYRTTTGVTGTYARCPSCGGDLLVPRDAMS
jgi:hypothetical protein